MKRFAPLALLFGLLTALMLGSASTALAHPSPPGHSGANCTKGLVNATVLSCNNILTGVLIPIVITGNEVLTDNEISIVEDNLNDNKYNITELVNVYNNEIDVDVSKIELCAVVGVGCLTVG